MCTKPLNEVQLIGEWSNASGLVYIEPFICIASSIHFAWSGVVIAGPSLATGSDFDLDGLRTELAQCSRAGLEDKLRERQWLAMQMPLEIPFHLNKTHGDHREMMTKRNAKPGAVATSSNDMTDLHNAERMSSIDKYSVYDWFPSQECCRWGVDALRIKQFGNNVRNLVCKLILFTTEAQETQTINKRYRDSQVVARTLNMLVMLSNYGDCN